MTKPDLAALSDAATQELLADDGYYFRGSYSDLMRCSHGETAYFNEHNDGLFIRGLWNAYRAGDLVLIDRERLRERVIAAMLAKLGPLVGSPEYLADPVKLARAEKRRQDSAEAYADTAIAAILGGDHE